MEFNLHHLSPVKCSGFLLFAVLRFELSKKKTQPGARYAGALSLEPCPQACPGMFAYHIINTFPVAACISQLNIFELFIFPTSVFESIFSKFKGSHLMKRKLFFHSNHSLSFKLF
jgi:hypothetical protein